MGSTFAADSKLMFYPTDEFETYRILALLGTIEYKNPHQMNKDYYLSIMSPEEYYYVTGFCLDKNIPSRFMFYDWFIRNRPQEVKDHFTIRYTQHNQDFTIMDLFCGNGDWLKSFRDFMPSQKSILVGNEIEEGRYKKAKKGLDHCYNYSFEELRIPKKSASIMLYNPPYGGDRDERNARKYLREIIEREYLCRDLYESSIIVAILRVDDMLDCSDILAKNFQALNLYKVQPKEFEKYKQLVYVGKALAHPLSDENVTQSIKLLDAISTLKTRIENLGDKFDYSNYYRWNFLPIAKVNFTEIIDNFTFVLNKEKYVSKNDGIWKWMKDKTAVYDTGVSQLIMPRPPKLAEIANIVAAGYINSDVDTGDSKHIAVGGIKTLVKNEEVRYNDGGREGTQTTVTKLSVPYLNVLYSENGKLKIKEICEET